jgi:hypothetical protein
MPNNTRPSPGDAPDQPPMDDAEPRITPLDAGSDAPTKPLFGERARRVAARRRVLVTALALVVLLAVVLSAAGAWQPVAAPLNAARQWLQPPSLVVESPVPWAQVWVDGRDVGGPDARIPLSLGSHTVTVRASGFAPYTRHLSLGDTLRSISGGLTIDAPEQARPGVVGQIEAAINRALAATATSEAAGSVLIAPGATDAPGRVGRAPLRARLTIAMITSGPLFTCPPPPTYETSYDCQQRVADFMAGTPVCKSPAPFPDVLCLSPYLALLNQSAANAQRAVVGVRAQLAVQFFDAGTGQLVYTMPIHAPDYQGELVQLWPAGDGWQVSTTLVGTGSLSDFQASAGQAELMALLPPSVTNGMPPLQVTPLTPVGEGVLFTAYLPTSTTSGPPGAPTWLFHLGTLYTLGTVAHQLTPGLPPVPQKVMPLVRDTCAFCIAESGALIPNGGLIYVTAAPGRCAAGDGSWSQNVQATEACSGNQLVVSDANCPCPLAMAQLDALPGVAFPKDYLIEVTAQAAGTDPATSFGIKFRAQHAVRGDRDWGGYAFLLDIGGRWQFNRYNEAGARTIVAMGQWAHSLTGVHTIDVAVHGARFTLYLDGAFVTTQYDTTYRRGVLALVVGPGGTVSFSDLGIYALP